jgi:hypothetical protein
MPDSAAVVACLPEAGQDVSTPARALLEDLRLLHAKNADVSSTETSATSRKPSSLGVIESDILEINKNWSRILAAGGALIGALGGGTGLLAWGKHAPAATQASLFLGASLIVASALIGIALIVRGDVSARTLSTQAHLAARATVASAFLDAAARSGTQGTKSSTPETQGVVATTPDALVSALAHSHATVIVTATDQADGLVATGLRSGPGTGTQVRVATGDWIDLAEVTTFVGTWEAGQ